MRSKRTDLASADTRRMAETGTGSGRSPSGAVGAEGAETPNLSQTNPTDTPIERLKGLLAKATSSRVWGARGFEVVEVSDPDERPEPSLRWHVHANGVGSWPIAWFYEEKDARLWSEAVNFVRNHIATIERLPSAAGEGERLFREQTRIVKKLCDIIDCEAEDVGHGLGSSMDALRELGPVNDKALAHLATLPSEPLPASQEGIEGRARREALEEAARIADAMYAHSDRDTPKAAGCRFGASTIARSIRALSSNEEGRS
jgi:hypothetical protein